MRKRYAMWLLSVLLVVAVPLRSDSKKGGNKFSSFWGEFRAAVTHKDEPALARLMAPHFQFIRAVDVAPADVFKGLNADGGRGWANLQDSLRRQPIVYRPQASARPQRLLTCTPTDATYNCLIVFEQDDQHHWQWKGMIMPTRN